MGKTNQDVIITDLMKVMEGFPALIAATTSVDQVKALLAHRDDIQEKIDDWTDGQFAKDDQDYKAAVSGLEKASKAIQDAIAGMKATADAIDAIATAVGLVAQVVPK